MAPERLKVPEEADGPNNEARMHENGNLKPAKIPIDPQLEHWTGGMPDGSASAEIEAFQQNVGPDNVSTGRSTNPEEHDPYASRPSVPSAAAAVDLNASLRRSPRNHNRSLVTQNSLQQDTIEDDFGHVANTTNTTTTSDINNRNEVTANTTNTVAAHPRTNSRAQSGNRRKRKGPRVSCPYDGCSTTCVDKGTLTRHISNKHTRTQTFRCTFPGCPKSFYRHDHLLDHMGRRGPHKHALVTAAEKPEGQDEAANKAEEQEKDEGECE
ncbi:hypothetical protein IWZ00DRAFT_544511 [Phyllosticta capitalensis]